MYYCQYNAHYTYWQLNHPMLTLAEKQQQKTGPLALKTARSPSWPKHCWRRSPTFLRVTETDTVIISFVFWGAATLWMPGKDTAEPLFSNYLRNQLKFVVFVSCDTLSSFNLDLCNEWWHCKQRKIAHLRKLYPLTTELTNTFLIPLHTCNFQRRQAILSVCSSDYGTKNKVLQIIMVIY